ncbi:MAG: hypothetical protein ABIJ09_27500 [Pseudomonadota bacterium]
MPRATLAVPVGLLLLAACPATDKKETTPSMARCEVSAQLVASAGTCVNDDHCPCGTHCALGTCTADCSSDAQCGGGLCDSFGRCRAVGDENVTPFPSTVRQAPLTLSTKFLRFHASGVTRQVKLGAPEQALGPVRVTAPEGFSVACTASTFASECSYPGIAGLDSQALRVRLDGEPATTPAGVLGIFSGSDRYSLTVEPTADAQQGPRAGVYLGSATIKQRGVGLDGSPLPAVEDELSYPLTAELFADGTSGSGILVVNDAQKLLHPSGRLIGSLQLASGSQSGSLQWPAYTYLMGTALAGLSSEVVARPAAAEVLVTGASPTLSFELELSFAGVGDQGPAPRVVYSVVLSRSGVLPATAPRPQLPAAQDPPLARRDIPSTWETRVQEALSPEFGSFDVAAGVEAGAYFGLRRDAGYLDVCKPADAAKMVTEAARAFWHSEDPASSDPLVVAFRDAKELAGYSSTPITSLQTDLLIVDASLGGAFPCQISPRVFRPHLVDQNTLDMGSVDACDVVAENYGCTVRSTQDAAVLTTRIVVSSDVDLDPATTQPRLRVYEVPTDVERVCVFDQPTGCAGCAQLSLCWDGHGFEPEDVTHDSTKSSLFSASLDAAGESTCSSGTRSAGLVDARGSDGFFKVFEACMTDLEDARQAPASTAWTNGKALDDLFANTGCLGAGRFAFALGQATGPARRPPGATAQPDDAQALALTQHLLQSWLTLHGLVAREALQLDSIQKIVELPTEIQPVDALDVSLAGWHLLLHPRVFSALQALPDAVAYAPDYRRFYGASEQALKDSGPDAQAGLAPLLLETLDAQASLLRELMLRAQRCPVDCPPVTLARVRDALAQFLRTEAPVRAIAAGLVAQAQRHAAEQGLPPARWLERYVGSERTYDGTLRALLRAARDAELGRNPLGIADSDLPLYFFGDESTATSRFTAISDFLLGAPGSISAFGRVAVQQAKDARVAAQEAGLALQQRQFEQALDDAQLADRLDQIRRTFGDQVIGYCGLPAGVDPLDVLEHWPSRFSANNCFILSSDPSCQVPVEAYEQAMQLDDLQYQFCVVRELRTRTAQGIGFLDPAYEGVSDEIAGCSNPTFPAECPEGVPGPCMSCQWSPRLSERIVDFTAGVALDAAGALDDVALLDAALWTGCAGAALTGQGVVAAACVYCAANPDDARCACTRNPDGPGCRSVPVPPSVFQAFQGMEQTPVALLEEARTTCQRQFPRAREQLPRVADLPGQPLTDRACYNGGLGESALELKGVVTDLDIARSEMTDLQDSYDVAIRSCIIQQVGNDAMESALAQHNQTMAALRTQKAKADQATAFLDAFEDAAATLAGGPTSLLAAGVAVGAGLAGGFTEAESIDIEAEMANAEASHEALMLNLQNEVDEQLCFNDAELFLVGVRTASLRVQKAISDMNVALYKFEQDKSSAQTAHDAGRAALKIAAARQVRPPSNDFWFDEKVDTYQRKLRIARRILYLAVRAVAYEFQESRQEEARVLAAETPEELDAVADDLRTITATRGIGGNRPSDLKVVLSLRKNLLQLGDLSQTQPVGWHRLTDVERFRMVLRSQRFAQYDDSGAYVGQSIPFSLAPLAAFGLGEVQGVPVFASSDCAERLWNVNASILGSSLTRGDTPTFVRIDLLKSNTFFSQWCAPHEASFQTASVRPSRNLFREPDEVDPAFGSALGVGRSDERSRARMQAYFNVDRAEFERDAYANGSTSELAARGLYGEYALFIPAALISRTPQDDGLVLENIDDILLRLDYVSVAR